MIEHLIEYLPMIFGLCGMVSVGILGGKTIKEHDASYLILAAMLAIIFIVLSRVSYLLHYQGVI